ncbi:hypothetical protein EUTSA_v10001094mg [Eutrema salsugineum]|uniref:Uncharacterized protein n=1 Tax=Eutrema salsugineum TaxID=72664 RepID=V4LB77_EUTSA|nr:hypothetical protein EUTSA_v10001094mg [Eutrema salsugineum]
MAGRIYALKPWLLGSILKIFSTKRLGHRVSKHKSRVATIPRVSWPIKLLRFNVFIQPINTSKNNLM